MDKKNNKPFEVNLLKEKEYFRLHVTHNSFKGRIRKNSEADLSKIYKTSHSI